MSSTPRTEKAALAFGPQVLVPVEVSESLEQESNMLLEAGEEYLRKQNTTSWIKFKKRNGYSQESEGVMSEETESEIEFSDNERAKEWLASAASKGKSDTPRTDAEAMDGEYKVMGSKITLQSWDYKKDKDGEVVSADFARTLERELSDLRKELDCARRSLENNCGIANQNTDALQAKLAASESRNKELRGALEQADSYLHLLGANKETGAYELILAVLAKQEKE